MEDLYKILGIDKNATQDEIKKAYRALSLKWHPDRNPNNTDATSTFQSISAAYEILGDENKRKQYDFSKNNSNKNNFNHFNFGPGHHPSGMQFPFPFPFTDSNNPHDELMKIFSSNIFHNFNHPNNTMHNNSNSNTHYFTIGPNGPIRVDINRQNQNIKPQPISRNIEITIDKAFSGCVIPVDITRWFIDGEIKKEEKETLYVTIPRGIDDNEIIIINDKGNSNKNDIKGDVKIQVKIKNDTIFKREGLDLILRKSISLKEALCGFSFNINFIDGRTFKINNNQGNVIYPNFKKIIPNMGMVRDNNIGNLVIFFDITFPENLSDDAISAITKVL